MVVTNIVEDNEIMDEGDIAQEDWNLIRLVFDDSMEVLKWCARRQLIRNSVQCEICIIGSSLVSRKDCGDGYRWQCRLCGKRTSIRDRSCFARSNLSIQKIIWIIYCWSRDYPQKDIAHEVGMSEKTNHTMIDWCNFLRKICELDLEENAGPIGGLDENGFSKIVEIDDSQFFHRKYRRGQKQSGHWVFGGIERETGKCFLVEVADRKEETLFALIEWFVYKISSMVVSKSSLICFLYFFRLTSLLFLIILFFCRS